MESIKLLALAITQGLSELLPISSSAHLILLGQVINIPTSTLLLSSLHIGTTIAILAFFWKKLFSNFFTKKKWTFYIKILLSVIPSAILGVLFESKIESVLHDNWIIAVSLIFWGILMILAQNKKDDDCGVTDMENVTWQQSLIMGFAQAIALIPGTSRSGVTTLSGIALGLNKYTAFEYSLILGLPILIGAPIWEILKMTQDTGIPTITTLTMANYIDLGIILLVPFIVGCISLIALKKISRDKWLSAFGIYRIILGVAILVFGYLL
ncbi:MAG: Undecaprenyl-diphosphatase [candidate division WS6 bacterium GW2011_GWC2_36_7]|uniref:Undecaprenyl-diphosphatase n=1 Tax=candidate division WS6 bacterium GW2011_GWC2_36_7 TaxID=1619091 RepID=A0A0G0EZ47_9BACT|nr:MAG: Undecaprenyl-diphosphatase [candidate division WS6 bacterium GW2011_WS6_36_26]KKQ12138.1 MAG: Undecaprenyl-diphosphatase [candidate division WS6 bacterium GW2011_GWC2_36_7]